MDSPTWRIDISHTGRCRVKNTKIAVLVKDSLLAFIITDISSNLHQLLISSLAKLTDRQTHTHTHAQGQTPLQ